MSESFIQKLGIFQREHAEYIRLQNKLSKNAFTLDIELQDYLQKTFPLPAGWFYVLDQGASYSINSPKITYRLLLQNPTSGTIYVDNFNISQPINSQEDFNTRFVHIAERARNVIRNY